MGVGGESIEDSALEVTGWRSKGNEIMTVHEKNVTVYQLFLILWGGDVTQECLLTVFKVLGSISTAGRESEYFHYTMTLSFPKQCVLFSYLHFIQLSPEGE